MPQPSLGAAWKFWLANDFSNADRECRAVLRQTPDTTDAWRLRSRIALKLGHREAVAEILESGYAASGSRDLLRELIAFQLRDRNPEEARRWLRELGQTQENAAAFAFQLGLCDWLEGEHAHALARFREACAKDPENREYPVRTARALASLGNACDAARCLNALSRESRGPDGYALLALCEFDAAGPEAALDVTREALALHPSDSRSHYLHEVLLDLCGREQANPLPDRSGMITEERDRVRWKGFTYARRAGPGAQWHGLDTAVLAHGIEAAPAAGLVLEFGVYQALSLRFIADRVTGTVHGFDSFQGLPEAWKEGEGAGSYNTRGRLPSVPPRVELHAGWFKDSLPQFVAGVHEPVRLLHMDCDLYSSTATVLQHVAPLLRPGTIIVFDEYLGYSGYEDHEYRAWHELVEHCAIEYEYLAFNLMAKKAALRIMHIEPPRSSVL